MAIEIERKFLVQGAGWKCVEPVHMLQGYLNTDRSRTVRIRVAGTHAFLGIKGMTTGISRLEFEYAIPVDEAQEMLQLCSNSIVEKQRHVLPVGKLVWEIDEFFGANEGLIIAEVELQSETQSITLPKWVGEEVSGDPRYYNASLAIRPYSDWV